MNLSKVMRAFLLLFIVLPIVHGAEIDDVRRDLYSSSCNAFQKYPMLNEMKTSATLMLIGEDIPNSHIQFAKEVKSFINSFCQIYSTVESSDKPDVHASTIEKMVKLKSGSGYLYQPKNNPLGSNAEMVVKNSQDAIQHFLRTEGGFFSHRASNETVTPVKIFYFKQAALAYSESGRELDAADNEAEAKTLEKKYTDDMSETENLVITGSEKYNSAMRLASLGSFNKIDAYLSAKESLKNFEKAGLLYKYHSESKKLSEVENKITELKAVVKNLRTGVAILFALIAAALMATTSFLIFRLQKWSNDKYEVSLGSELAQVSGYEA